MAKMIDGLLQGFRLHRLNRLRDQKSFLENYLPILVKAIRDREERRIKLARERDVAALRGPALAAGILTPALETEQSAALANIEERYRWRAKALAQSQKRAAIRSHGAVDPAFAVRAEQLERQKQTDFENVGRRYAAPQGDLAAAREAFRIQAEEVHAATDARLAATGAKADKIIAAKTAAYETKTDELGRKIEKVRNLLIANKSDETNALIPEDALLSVRNLSMRFGGLMAVDNLSFDVKKGEIFGLIGPNGAGKTTIFNCITRFYRPTSGEMLYRKNAVEVIRLNDYPVHDIIRQGIVRTFQNVELV
ncbi:MAG: ATP-binding cassette domain-containing protein, partial [Bacillota bacterium]|nr:ATP-binding cassette domain-containing protein [Bacillota bacterium]